MLVRTLSFMVAVLFSVAAAGLPVIPGTQYVGCGVNLTNMQLGMGKVIDLTTFTYGITWENTITGQSYNVPDMMVAMSDPVSNVSIGTSTFSSVTDFQTWALHHYSWHSGLFGMVSHSKTTYDYLERRYTMDETMSLSTLDMTFLQLTIPTFPPPDLAPVFQAAINALPATCCGNDADYQMYMEFFASFGHGWIAEANMGGRMWYESWLPICFLSITSVSWVEEQSGWNFLHIIGDGHGHKSSTNQANATFTACLAEQYIFEGGNQMLQSPDFYELWAPTIYNNPVPLNFQVLPYSTLISDPGRAAAMDAATAQFLGQAQQRMEAYEANLAQHDPHLHPICCSQLQAAYEAEQAAKKAKTQKKAKKTASMPKK